MSEEKRRILDMVEQGTITQEDAARLLEALGENEPAPAQPQESQPPQDGTWEAEHQGDEDCQGPNQRVEIHLEGEGAKPIYQEITSALDEAAPVFENLGKIVEDAVTSATQAVDAAWPQVKEAVSSATEKAKDAAQSAAQAARESVLVGAVVPGKAALTPLPLEENAYQAPAGGPVTRLRVEWVNGPVEIRPWEGDTIRVAEYAARPLKDSERMELQENGGKLRIRWSRARPSAAGCSCKSTWWWSCPRTPPWRSCGWTPSPAGRTSPASRRRSAVSAPCREQPGARACAPSACG